MKYNVGDIVPVASVQTISGRDVLLKDQADGGLVHIQLRRFSGCAICNSHLYDYAKQLEELRAVETAAKKRLVSSVVVFHSHAEVLQQNQGSVDWARPLDIVADPSFSLYNAFKAEQSVTGILNYSTIHRALTQRWNFNFSDKGINGTRFQLPMDALVDSSTGKILAIKYGSSFNDQWSANELKKIISSLE